jgi:hypothetical protein
MNQAEKTPIPLSSLLPQLPPYVARILRTLCEDPEPALLKVKVPHSPEDDFFYECDVLEDVPRIASYLERPRVLTNLNGSGH